MSQFTENIGKFVAKKTAGYSPSGCKEKIIHDPIWGSVLYYGWEIQLIDSPLMQRLRDIHQLGMADMTYTAARHSRFEHSLGTTAMAGRMMQRLYERYRDDPELKIKEADIYKVRLAALLHDVGHCFFSHLSENVYANMPEFKAAHQASGCACSAHEFMSYSIIRSEEFCDFFYEKIDFPNKGDRDSCKKLLDDAANMVAGTVNRDENGIGLTYMTSIINGEFDADKIDYIQRDSYTAGIAMTYGIERFLLKLILHKDTSDGVSIRLAVGAEAMTTIEELIFNRSLLYVYMYRHQKVLATEAAIKDIIYGMVDLGYIKQPCDFLEFRDNDIENLRHSDKIPFESDGNTRTLGEMVTNVCERKLPKRYREYSIEMFNEKGIFPELEDRERINHFVKKYSADSAKELIQVRKILFEELSAEYKSQGKEVDFTLFDIFPVFPKPFRSDTSFLLVSKDNRLTSASEIRYIREWAAAFSANKWRGYVFMMKE